RLWFLWNLIPDDAGYNITGAVRLKGDLDIAALRQALSGLVQRHEVLRTTFDQDAEGPFQTIHDEPVYGWREVDLVACDESAEDLLAEGARSPFDLRHGPVFRTLLIRVSEQEHILQFGMHHIASDGWSMGILVRDFCEFYAAAVDGRAPDLAPLTIQYADYALWQREWLDDAALEGQLAYWQDRLGGEQPVTTLPLDRPRRAPRNRRGGSVGVHVSSETVEGLRRLSRKHGATLFMTLLAAFDLLLYRYGGDEDIRIGVPVAGRNRVETEGLVGFFVNTLVLKADVTGTMPVGALIDQVRDRLLEAQTHQDLPFERLVAALQPVRDQSISPLFQ
ncbi:non-ribosomal peptide synthetase, partial [Acetobacter senegalensis]|uniref:condensation domain-containing protein n=1 Tax=Acetobacter senegalensis TaxID=446692 RepID=UPI001EDB723C